jgi:hypothetical protein
MTEGYAEFFGTTVALSNGEALDVLRPAHRSAKLQSCVESLGQDLRFVRLSTKIGSVSLRQRHGMLSRLEDIAASILGVDRSSTQLRSSLTREVRL